MFHGGARPVFNLPANDLETVAPPNRRRQAWLTDR
jgi:hypothetical protein